MTEIAVKRLMKNSRKNDLITCFMGNFLVQSEITTFIRLLSFFALYPCAIGGRITRRTYYKEIDGHAPICYNLKSKTQS